MTTLMAERRRALTIDDGQESLFGGEELTPSRREVRWERPVPAQDQTGSEPEIGVATSAPGTGAGHAAPEGREAPTAGDALAPPEVGEPASALHPNAALAAPGDAATPTARADAALLDAPARADQPAGDELAALERAPVAVDDLRSPRTVRAPLAGPTLDDMMSRAWEGLAVGLPAACPVCRGEIVPSLSGPASGCCSSCHATIQ